MESMVCKNQYVTSESRDPSVDTDKLSYEIFSILESKFLFGYDDDHGDKFWLPKHVTEVIGTKNEPSLVKNNGGNGQLSRGKICILSIDGGEMQGILSGKALTYLEASLKKKSGNSEARLADYFDVGAGTGIGGIFTAMLFATKGGGGNGDGDDDTKTLKKKNVPIFEAADTWKFLMEQGKVIFKSPPSSSKSLLLRRFKGCSSGGDEGSTTVKLEKVLKEAFRDNGGRNLTLKDTLKPVLIPCYDLSSSSPFLFSRADALENESFDFRLWEVCRATSAKPSVFDPVSLRSVDGQTKCVAVDGGLTMNNPTAAAITHVLHNKQEFPFVRGVEDLLVLSLGSGQLLDGNYDYEQVKGWKAKEWARPMARIAGDGAGDLVDQAVAMAFGQSRSTNYVRIQANGSNSYSSGVSLDSDSGSRNSKMLVGLAEDMLKQKNVESVLFGGKRIAQQTNFEKLDWFAGELILEHQRRSSRLTPTVAFKQATHKPS
ncbi:hypothetical protein MKW94_019112 [Papaver nudicaule]|uniref:Patatin n=1 Tax=Papaver nudicaule TaxID=74823 RepID=A0AA42AQ70_PAPNU|nr:hypothetical protein [Papaver nudicaule]